MTSHNFQPSVKEKAKCNERRPKTGGIDKHMSKTMIDNNENTIGKIGFSKRVGTAKINDTQDRRYISQRVFTPQADQRPNSRYNKASLYTGLENGRKSPEYKVPIIDMKLKEYEYHNSVMPSFWKQ